MSQSFQKRRKKYPRFSFTSSSPSLPIYQPNCSQCNITLLSELATRSPTILLVSPIRLPGPQAATIVLSCSSVPPIMDRIIALMSGRPSIIGRFETGVDGEQLPDADFSGSEIAVSDFSKLCTCVITWSDIACLFVGEVLLAFRERVT
jgi:hypothetical protein